MECIRVTWRRKMGKKNNKKGLFPLFCCLAKAPDTPLHSLLCTLWPFQTPLTSLLLDSCLIWKCWDHTHRCTEVHFCFTATLKKRYNRIKKKFLILQTTRWAVQQHLVYSTLIELQNADTSHRRTKLVTVSSHRDLPVCLFSVCLFLHLSVLCSLQCSRASSGCKHSVCHCIVCHFVFEFVVLSHSM